MPISIAIGQGVVFGSGAPSGPIPTSGLQLWLDAAEGVTGAVDATVTAWADQSGNGNDPALTNGDLTHRASPTRIEATDDATADALVWTSWPLLESATTLFFVVETTRFDPQTLAAGGANKYFLRQGASTSAGESFDGIGASADHYFNGSLVANPSPRDVRDNIRGVGKVIATVHGADLSAWGTVDLLGDTADGTSQFGGDVYEIIGYDTKVSTANREAVEEYLATKYSITLT